MYGHKPCDPSGGWFDATWVRPQFPSRQSFFFFFNEMRSGTKSDKVKIIKG